MKKNILISAIFSVLVYWSFGATINGSSCCSINGMVPRNTLKSDTIKYLHENIVGHKEKFQHKELSVLLKELHLEVKSYIFIHGPKPGGPPKCITLFFDDKNNTSSKLRKRINIPFLNIYFENEISRDKLSELQRISHGAWLAGENDYFGNMVVKDVTGTGGENN